jgi:biotin carboxylase
MKVAVIGISFYQRHLLDKLKNEGYYIIGIDGNPNPYGKDIVDSFIHIDVKDSDAIIQTLLSEDIKGVFSVASDVTLSATSKVTTALGLPGMSYETYSKFESKDKYYDLFDSIGVSIPKTYRIEDLDKLPTKKYIVKPSQGAGNRGVKIVEDIHSFDFTHHQNTYYREGEIHLIQDYITGQKHTLDGIVYNNKFYPLAFSKSYNREGESLSDEIHFSPHIDEIYNDKVLDYCNKIATHISDPVITPLHIELISNEDNIYIIDFSLRGGGYDIFTSLINNLTGYDVLGNYIDSILGKEIKLPNSDIHKSYSVMNLIYANKPGIIQWDTDPDVDTDLVFFKKLVNNGDSVKYPQRDGDRIAYSICYGATLEKAQKLSNYIESELKYQVNGL